jgi:hypothetical protein
MIAADVCNSLQEIDPRKFGHPAPSRTRLEIDDRDAFSSMGLDARYASPL